VTQWARIHWSYGAKSLTFSNESAVSFFDCKRGGEQSGTIRRRAKSLNTYPFTGGHFRRNVSRGSMEKKEEQCLIHGVANHGFSKNSKNQASDLAPSMFTLPRKRFRENDLP